jgi:hypothetical protein
MRLTSRALPVLLPYGAVVVSSKRLGPFGRRRAMLT